MHAMSRNKGKEEKGKPPTGGTKHPPVATGTLFTKEGKAFPILI
jgi:hypothetical protein